MINIVRKIFPSLMSSLNISRSYFYDTIRFIKYNTNNSPLTSEPKSLALLVRATHGLEKAFSLPKMKSTFGSENAKYLMSMMEHCLKVSGDGEQLRDAAKVMANYLDYHATQEGFESLKNRFDTFLSEINIDLNKSSCFKVYDPIVTFDIEAYTNFILSRHSIRNFKEQIIPINRVYDILELARHTPSACNRQPWKVRLFQSMEDIEEVLTIQNGNRGFSSSIHNLILITGDLSNFSSKERNQAYIDGGLYSMALINAIHAHGLASCALNMSYQSTEERKMRSVLKLQGNEVPIMMLAFGYPSDGANYCSSTKRSVKDILLN
ncbi:nitroreductase family protein [Vibrio crassostreae]|uniref:nitroreductase family protein n=1 Tax=Vibrio crassostreae TaxID=246167 RepID=UPI001B30A751|nr:nitroreductase family protein [Vibrio crassostreae]